jgi:hypothetical protein
MMASLKEWMQHIRGSLPVEPTDEQTAIVRELQEVELRVAALEQQVLTLKNRMGIRHGRPPTYRQSA